jgi:hypothetical protein
MTMTEIVDKMVSIIEAGTGTYLTDAVVLVGDPPQGQRDDHKVTVCVVPLPSEDMADTMGPGAWDDLFRVNIRAWYPDAWNGTRKHLALAEELKQIIRDNVTWANSSSQRAVLRKRKWGYGYDALGAQTLNRVDIIVEYQADGPTPS